MADEITGETASDEPRHVELSDKEWRERLSREQYWVLRDKGTERPFSGRYAHPGVAGNFRCAGCGSVLFAATDQFDSGSGWPSFTRPVDDEAVELNVDRTLWMRRIEVTCKTCGGHLGHVFKDGPAPTGERWCINSLSLTLDEDASPPPR